MHTVTALLCFVVVIHWLIFPYPSGLLHWHCGNLTIAPGPAKLMNMDKYFMWIHYDRLHNHNKAKHNKTVCIFLGIYCTSLHPYLNALNQMAMLYVWLPLSQWKCWLQFYQTRSAWSMDQGSTKKCSAVHNFCHVGGLVPPTGHKI